MFTGNAGSMMANSRIVLADRLARTLDADLAGRRFRRRRHSQEFRRPARGNGGDRYLRNELAR
jgi:hypothetical protein